MSKDNQLLLWQCLASLLLVAVLFVFWDGRCKSRPPDPRGYPVSMVALKKGTQVMRDGRVRRMVEFQRRDADYALSLSGDVYVQFERETVRRRID